MGPPWQSTMTSSRTALAASAHASMSPTHSSSDFAVCAPMLPLVVSPMWQTMISAPACVMATASSSEKT